MIASAVTYHFPFNPVMIEEVKAAARSIVAVAEGGEVGANHARFGGIQIVDLDADMVERDALFPMHIGVLAIGAGVERDITAIVAKVDR